MYLAAISEHNVLATHCGRGGKMIAAEIEAREVAEIDAVRRWRFDELLRAGYDDDDATELAFHIDIDLHWAASLVRRGCPSSTAVQIAL